MLERRTNYDQRNGGRFRHAFSLVEVLVVVTLSSVLLGVVVSFTVSLMKWDRRTRGAGVVADQLAELAATLRRDIRQASKVTLDDENRALAVARSDGSRVEYSIDPEGCRRIVRAANGSQLRTEFFTIGESADWSIELLPRGRHPLLAVTLRRIDSSESAAEMPPLVVYGALGADLPTSTGGGEP